MQQLEDGTTSQQELKATGHFHCPVSMPQSAAAVTSTHLQRIKQRPVARPLTHGEPEIRLLPKAKWKQEPQLLRNGSFQIDDDKDDII